VSLCKFSSLNVAVGTVSKLCSNQLDSDVH